MRLLPVLGRTAFLLLALLSSCKSGQSPPDVSLNPTKPFTEGKYVLEQRGGSASELQITNVSDTALQFQLIAVGGPPAYNQGFMEGRATIAKRVAVYEIDEFGGVCKLAISPVDSLSVKVETIRGGDSTCGFGRGVVPDGVYKFTQEVMAPEFDPALLNGIWRSTIDPTYELQIVKDSFTEFNRGEKVDVLKCTFYNDCPAPCSGTGMNNCLLAWNEQDTFCYAVLLLDLKRLELSLTGGNGQSIVYERLK